MNKCTIIGRLTRDPEVRTVKDGITVCTFTVPDVCNVCGEAGVAAVCYESE